MKKLLVSLVAALLLVGQVAVVRAASPSSGATIVDHQVPVDGAGAKFDSAWQLGFKVFEAFQTTTAQLVVDEAGVAPTCGVLHMICISTTAAASNYVVAFDSASASGLTGLTTGKALTAPMNGSTTLGMSCSPALDAQFNKGLVLLENDATAVAYAYWRPCRGGRN